ncbi:MAG: sensor histidine kinase, partial [Haloquadratum sp.]
TERKAYEKRLEEQRDGLDLLNQVLRHDIRNDLQVVTGYGEVLTDHVDDEGADYLDTLRTNAEHAVELTRTARDLADVMLSTEGEKRDRVPLRETLEAEIDKLDAEYPAACVAIEGSVPAVPVRADAMLDSVFRNLLTNAVQHNDKDVPEISIAATADDERVTVRIADNGPGVPDDQKETIFGKGEKGLDSEGTGLGLYLVQHLVTRYGGSVWVEDSDPTGAVFVVELPRADAGGMRIR